MSNNNQVIKYLNIILGNELIAINQYFLHAKIFQDRGFNKLASLTKSESIDEMKHADIIIDRILFLGGVPNMDKYSKLAIGKDIKSMINNDLNLEVKAIVDLKEAINVAIDAQDIGTKDLLEKILISEEEHLDFLQTQLELIKTIGIENYLTTQI